MSFSLPANAGPLLSRLRAKQIAPLFVAVVCGVLTVQQLGEVDALEVKTSIASVTSTQWIASVLATIVSFFAVGQYDALFHRWLKTGVSNSRSVVAGASAIALAQTLGVGLITGTLARWRALPELSLPTALKVTNYVSFSFMAGLGLVSLFVLALPGAGNLSASGFSIAALGVVLLTCALSFIQPSWLPFALPPLRMSLRLLVLVTVDVVMCAIAFWVLMPGEMQLPFPALLAAFTLALGAGLLSGSPGGVGPFELCMITLLPMFPEPQLIANVLAFRLVYYAVPAVIAAAILLRPRSAPLETTSRSLVTIPRRAEAKLGYQAGHNLTPTRAGDALHLGEASQMLVAIGDTARGAPLDYEAICTLMRAAAASSRWPMLYKCSSRSAVSARSLGWCVAQVSEDAWINPRCFSAEGPARRQLRRKLKRVEKAGVRIERAKHHPISEMTRVAKEWERRAGGERGFSMGRYHPNSLADQRVYLAWSGRALVGFMTFHVTDHDWALDLMRSTSDMPDGTMHALLAKAIEDARQVNLPRVSLAAMPQETPKLMLRWMPALGGQGLRQFKLSFAPEVAPLYAAAPNSALLALAAADILLRIRYPADLSPTVETSSAPPEPLLQAA